MKIFTLDKNYNVVCNWKNTRSGFKHIATLCRNGIEIGDTKICYLNRTWESFKYESILKKIIDLYFGEKNSHEKYLKGIKKLGL